MFPWLAAATVAAPLVSNLLGSKTKGQSGVTGPSVITLPQYSFTEPRLKLTSDFISSNIQNLSEGKFPTYYQNALPALRENMARPLRATYFGSDGVSGGLQGKGVIGQIRETGAALGVGPKATVARENKALFDYANSEKEIDEYLTKLGVDIAHSDAQYFTGASSAMPQGPSAVVVPGSGYNVPQAPSYLADFMKTAGSALPYMMGDWGKQPQYVNSYSNGQYGYNSGGYPSGYAQNMKNYNQWGQSVTAPTSATS